jgi:hypothetical protein
MAPVPIERSNRLRPKAAASLRNIDHQGSLKVAQIAQANDTGQIAIGDVREIEKNNHRAEVTLSGALVEDLTARRTAALRAALASRADVALVACHARRGTTRVLRNAEL